MSWGRAQSCAEISDGSGPSVPMMSLFPRYVMGSRPGSFSHPGEGETQTAWLLSRNSPPHAFKGLWNSSQPPWIGGLEDWVFH